MKKGNLEKIVNNSINSVKRKDIEEAEFIGIGTDYAHIFKGMSGKEYRIYGWARPNLSTMQIGDKGMIYYQSSSSYGLEFFENYTKR